MPTNAAALPGHSGGIRGALHGRMHSRGICLALLIGLIVPAVVEAKDGTGPVAPSTTSLDPAVIVGGSFSGSDLLVASGGSLAVGEWFHQQYYLGGVGTFSLLAGSDASLNLARGGVEVRTAFAHGTGSQRINHGPSTPIPVIYWVGAAAGFETFNLGATNGAWADLELGMDMRGTIPIGMTLTVGGGLDAAAPEPTAGPLHATMALLVRFPFQV